MSDIRVTNPQERVPSWVQIVDFTPPTDELRRAREIITDPGWLAQEGVAMITSVSPGGAVIIATDNSKNLWVEFGYVSAGLSRQSFGEIVRTISSPNLSVLVVSSQPDALHDANPHSLRIEDLVKKQLNDFNSNPVISRITPKYDEFNLLLKNMGQLIRLSITPF